MRSCVSKEIGYTPGDDDEKADVRQVDKAVRVCLVAGLRETNDRNQHA